MKYYLPLATISILIIIVGVFALTTDITTVSSASSPAITIQHENLESILDNSQENKLSIQYTTEANNEPTINPTTIIQVSQPHEGQSIP